MRKTTSMGSNISAAGREANRHFKNTEAEKALTDREKSEKAFNDNRERLKTERLAREATEARLKAK
jgi:hypothetical protein